MDNQKKIRFWIHSDLHQDAWVRNMNRARPDLTQVPDLDSWDYRIIAGDLSNGIRDCFLDKHRQLPTLQVIGNHDAWGMKDGLPGAVIEAETQASGTNWTVLQNRRFNVPGTNVWVLGTTLFSNPYPELNLDSYKAAHGDINMELIAGMTVDEWTRQHALALEFLETSLHGIFFEDPTARVVIVSHFAPSMKSISPEFEGARNNFMYATNLEFLMEKYPIKLWVHGHMHRHLAYKVKDTLVVCNPLGYVIQDFDDENPNYKPDLILEV